ncbi:Teichoic acid translocation permease protein TagG [bacterium HR19]|nr:Teichoic acid translocation permease protein TagG [bacterium HR19]
MQEKKETIIIKPPSSVFDAINLKEIISRIDLLFALAIRDIKIRYRRTIIGFGWAVIQPFAQMVIFSLIFGKFTKIPSENVPYPIFVYSALVPWQLFARALNDASMSVVNNIHIISKIYFPRIILPMSVIISALVDFFSAFSILILLMIFYGVIPTAKVLLFPVFVFVEILCALGVALWLSALNVKFRDVKYTLQFLTQIWLFATPVIYPAKIIPEKFKFIFALNPMTGVVEGFRWILLNTTPPDFTMMAISTLMIFIVFIFGVVFFYKMEKEFADIM